MIHEHLKSSFATSKASGSCDCHKLNIYPTLLYYVTLYENTTGFHTHQTFHQYMTLRNIAIWCV